MMSYEERLRRFKEEKEQKEQKEKAKKQKAREEAYKRYQEQYRLLHGQMKTSAELAHDRMLRRKALEEEKRKKREKEEERKQYFISRTVSVYNEKYTEREPREEDLYTKEELMNIELFPEETGRINWEYWNKLVSEVKKILQN